MENQNTIGDVNFMQGMIPHHSMAIATSKNANITDPRVKKLADKIIQGQEKEIKEMEALIKELT